MPNSNYRILSGPISYQEFMKMPRVVIRGIYKIENLVNHKVYIGQSINVINRIKDSHLNLSTNEHLKNAFLKYGFDNFSFEVIKETYDLDYWEMFLIQIYKATNPEYGYNLTSGGEGSHGYCYWHNYTESEKEETKTKIREARKHQAPMSEESKQKFKESIAAFWNSPKGQEQKRITSEKSKGRKLTKGLHWFNNGIHNIQSKECPEGFVPGRLGDFTCSEETKQKKRDIERNMTDEQRKKRSENISKAHVGKHFTEKQKKHIGDANRGRKYYNNGIIEVMRFECPEGFVPGRCPKAKQAIKKGMNDK